jgi:hypothetical protein
MSKFIVTKDVTYFFIVDADVEEEAIEKIAYVSNDRVKHDHADVIGYDIADPKNVPFDVNEISPGVYHDYSF